MKEGDCENGSTRKGTLGDLCGKVHHPSVPEIHIVTIKQELFKKITLRLKPLEIYNYMWEMDFSKEKSFKIFQVSFILEFRINVQVAY